MRSTNLLAGVVTLAKDSDFQADLARRPPVVTPTCWHGSLEDALLRQARLWRYDLVVMGVGRPVRETLPLRRFIVVLGLCRQRGSDIQRYFPNKTWSLIPTARELDSLGIPNQPQM